MKNIKILLPAIIVLVALIFVICFFYFSSAGSGGDGEGNSGVGGEERELLTFKEYLELSMEEQIAYYNSFADMDAYAAWYNVAKAEYELLYGPIGTPDDGDVDLGGDGEDDIEGDVGLGDKIPEDDNTGDNKGDEGNNPENPDDNPSDGDEGDDPENPDEGDGNEGDEPTDPDGGDGNEPGNEPENPDDNPSEGDEGDDPENPDEGDGPILLTWEEYLALSAEEQFAYYESFEDIFAFSEWYNNALNAYNEANRPPELPEGGVDLGGK